MLVFKVRSRGAFCPGTWHSEEKLPAKVDVTSPRLSDESAAKPLLTRGSSAASPLNALPYRIK